MGVSVVWVWCGCGVDVVWMWCGCGVGVVWVWCGCDVGVVWIWCRCGVGMVENPNVKISWFEIFSERENHFMRDFLRGKKSLGERFFQREY